MGSAHILIRVRGADGRWRAARDGVSGERRYLVRWRFAGRDSRLRHGGSFRTRREADLRRRYILDEIAAGRIPDLNPGLAVERSPTLGEALAEEVATRVDVTGGTLNAMRSDVTRISSELRAMRVGELTRRAIQEWVGVAVRDGVGAGSIQKSVRLMRRALDLAGVEPNPARGVNLPTYRSPEVHPPSAAELLALVASLPDHWVPVVCVLEGSGLRAREAERLLARDVDRVGGRIRVARQRTKGRTDGERWIPLRPATLALIPEPRSRSPEERILGFHASSLRSIMEDRIAHHGWRPYSLHGLRHRYISRLVAAGVPITEVVRRSGHSSAKLTLDTYSHVLLDDGVDPVLDLAELLDAS